MIQYDGTIYEFYKSKSNIATSMSIHTFYTVYGQPTHRVSQVKLFAFHSQTYTNMHAPHTSFSLENMHIHQTIHP